MGNLGLLDITQALLWLQENIASFYGDPKRVTLFGHGHGASLVNLLLVSPFTSGRWRWGCGWMTGCGWMWGWMWVDVWVGVDMGMWGGCVGVGGWRGVSGCGGVGGYVSVGGCMGVGRYVSVCRYVSVGGCVGMGGYMSVGGYDCV